MCVSMWAWTWRASYCCSHRQQWRCFFTSKTSSRNCRPRRDGQRFGAAATYDRPVGDLLMVQDDIGEQVGKALKTAILE